MLCMLLYRVAMASVIQSRRVTPTVGSHALLPSLSVADFYVLVRSHFHLTFCFFQHRLFLLVESMGYGICFCGHARRGFTRQCQFL